MTYHPRAGAIEPAAYRGDTEASPSARAPHYWMTLGTFAVGTESFMISPLLPRLATDLSVRVADAGQLVTMFAHQRALLRCQDGGHVGEGERGHGADQQLAAI
jgi:hypothetical protein